MPMASPAGGTAGRATAGGSTASAAAPRRGRAVMPPAGAGCEGEPPARAAGPSMPRLPMPQRAVVLQPVHRQVGALVRVLRGQRLVDLHAVAGRLARVQVAVLERVGMREHRIRLVGV